ncbi:MAG: hypothetical protein ABW201_00105 [Candidatus Thiodiazotropha sp.]
MKSGLEAQGLAYPPNTVFIGFAWNQLADQSKLLPTRLGGNRRGHFNTFRNLVLTMFLGGLWHGANWTFAVWGLAHGFILVVYHALEGVTNKILIPGLVGKIIGAIIFFHLVCITWLLFRAENLTQAVSMFAQMFHSFSMTEFSLYSLGMLGFFALPIVILELVIERSGDMLYVLRTH